MPRASGPSHHAAGADGEHNLDPCDYTLTRVREGVVSVRDEVKKKTVSVRKGKTYKAWAPKAKRKACVQAARKAKRANKRARRGDKPQRRSSRRK